MPTLSPEKIKERDKLSYQKNRDRKIASAKKYYSINKEKIKEYKKNYRVKNKEKLSTQNKKYYIENKGILMVNQRVYKKNRLKTDSLFKLKETTSTLIRNSFKNKGFKKISKTKNILGCTFQEFKVYIESKFESWMTWENRGLYNGEANYGWDIDHIIPLSSAKTEEDIIKLNHYTNLQPLCSRVNRDVKKDKIN